MTFNWVLSLSFKANYFSKFSKAPVICKLVGRKVIDGVGEPTLEVEIYCTVKNYEKVWATSSCFIYFTRTISERSTNLLTSQGILFSIFMTRHKSQLSVVTWKKKCSEKLDNGSSYERFLFQELDNILWVRPDSVSLYINFFSILMIMYVFLTPILTLYVHFYFTFFFNFQIFVFLFVWHFQKNTVQLKNIMDRGTSFT